MISLLTLVPAAVCLLVGFVVVRLGGRVERRLIERPVPAERVDTLADGAGTADPAESSPEQRRRGTAIGPVLIALGAFVMLIGLVLVGLWVLLEPVLGVHG